MICEYFLLFCGLPFHPVESFIWYTKVLNFDKVLYILVAVVDCAFDVISVKSTQNPMSWPFPSTFSSNISGFLTCNSVIHWTLECVLRARSYFVFKQVSHSFPQWLEMPRFTPYILIYEALMLTDPSVPLICHSIPVSALHSRFLITIHLNLTNFLQSSSLLIIILFQHFSGHLYMFMLNFRIILSPSVPKRVSLGLWSGLCYTWIW